MRSPAECKSRWDETLNHNSSLADLQRAVKFNGPNSPCVAGCRSVCWKVFLLFRNVNANNWSNDLHESRNTYSALKDHYLKYIKHPEKLAELSVDPLTDDPESPWDALRRDEVVRAEILQDVRRLPDEPLYHQEQAQNLILDILFVYCKLNPDIGGYRQGMHELLAPIFTVIYQDALEYSGSETETSLDTAMVEMLDVNFIEHDAFTLFSKLMEKAKSFYEMSTLPDIGQSSVGSTEQSTIVEMSRRIHEEVLMRVDPELAQHLKAIEILPQIFLIRWVRLLFGREFPFEQLLVLWDTMFAFDPDLNLVSLVCVAMLIRIRWTLLEADYSVALQLLLKYPAPQAPHGPHTFVDDAVYLKDHLNTTGGTNLILKYTGRAPINNPAHPRPTTPTFAGLNLRSRTLGARSPLASSARFIQNPGAVEALFQGAARNVIERGEKLGINQAVRDAMGEIRKNMQGLHADARHSARASRDSTAGDNTHSPFYSAVEMERRNRQLAAMLDEAITSLKSITANMPGGVKDAQAEAVDMAAAKVQFVKIHLEDPTLSLAPEDETMEPPPPPVNALSFTSNKENVAPIVAVDRTMVTASTAPLETPSDEVERLDDPLSRPSASHPPVQTQSSHAATQPVVADSIQADDDPMETDEPPSQQANPAPAPRPPLPTAAPARPTGPIPTRSTLAQSSFAWMLEPDQTSASHDPFAPPSRRRASSRPSSSSKSSGGGGAAAQHRKRTSGSGAASRERNAFLFGEVVPSAEGAGGGGGGGGGLGPLTSDEIFGLEPLRRALPKSKGL